MDISEKTKERKTKNRMGDGVRETISERNLAGIWQNLTVKQQARMAISNRISGRTSNSKLYIHTRAYIEKKRDYIPNPS